MTVQISLRWILLTLTTLPLIVISFLLYHQTRGLIALEGSRRVEEFKSRLMERKREELECLSEVAYRATKKYYDQSHQGHIGASLKRRAEEFKKTLLDYYHEHENRFPEETIQQFLVDFVKVYRFDDGVGYFWINDFQPKMICHPVIIELDGKDLSTYEDSRGFEVFNAMVKTCKEKGEGLVRYRWINPKTGKEEEKISFVFTFEPFDWIIGTGEYISVLKNKLQKKARNTLEKLRYSEYGYFWINDFDANMLMHPVRDELLGKNMMDYEDSNGKKVFQEAVEICKSPAGRGFLQYVGPKPGREEYQAKLSYVRTFKQWEWIIGTGLYLEDVESAVAKEKKRVEKEIDNLVGTFGWVAALSVLLIGTVTIILTNLWVNNPLDIIIAKLENFDNDLTVRLDGKFRFEFASLAFCFNKLLESLQSVIKQVKDAVGRVVSSTTEISGVVENQAAQLSQQSAAIAEVTATVEELSESSGQIADNAQTALSAAEEALNLSQKSSKAIKEVSSQMERVHSDNLARKSDMSALDEKSREITEIMKLINDIAEQTKLIAFNAALEASSAGERGKRFGVVAGEIRKLADNVMDSTKDIAGNIEEIQSSVQSMIASSSKNAEEVESGLKSTKEAVELIESMVGGAESTSKAARQISLSTQQQRTASNQIVTAMREISYCANDTTRDLETVSKSASNMEVLAKELEELVERFQVEDGSD